MRYDIIVIGGGHAGCEASLICAKRGIKVLLITLRKEKIGELSCNPAVGGIGKSQLVYEIDALGGEMGYITDQTAIGFRMLNTKKGPAVRALRAQVDRNKYREMMKDTILTTKGIEVLEDEVVEILVEKSEAIGVKTYKNGIFTSFGVILASGTFLNGLIHIGLKTYSNGRFEEPSATKLTTSLKKLGIKCGRLKTGTSPRIDGRTVDFEKILIQFPEEINVGFSHRSKRISKTHLPCYITWTNKKTQEIILSNLAHSPLYTGKIKGIGPRYCPSIEDKCVKFREKERHQVFLEPDGENTYVYYLSGLSTSLPLEIQKKILKTIPGLENAKIIRPGYGIEYDFIFPHQVSPTLECKFIKNLWFAGQILGTSGYEEAASQGIIAGINAGNKIKKLPPFILKRQEAYIGVLIDDIITKEIKEPYRMFTSRVEHRLVLRQDNADERLMKYGVKFRIVKEEEYKKVKKKREEVKKLVTKFKSTYLSFNVVNPLLKKIGSPCIKDSISLFKLLKRPEITCKSLSPILGNLPPELAMKVEIEAKYEGYITMEYSLISKLKKMETYKIPSNFDYSNLALSREASEKLQKLKPLTIGQASRIAGVRVGDLISLMHRIKKNGNRSKRT
jgi:tRNA uridine 5-carboxymethylaminomethyl modification enzyme